MPQSHIRYDLDTMVQDLAIVLYRSSSLCESGIVKCSRDKNSFGWKLPTNLVIFMTYQILLQD